MQDQKAEFTKRSHDTDSSQMIEASNQITLGAIKPLQKNERRLDPGCTLFDDTCS